MRIDVYSGCGERVSLRLTRHLSVYSVANAISNEIEWIMLTFDREPWKPWSQVLQVVGAASCLIPARVSGPHSVMSFPWGGRMLKKSATTLAIFAFLVSAPVVLAQDKAQPQ